MILRDSAERLVALIPELLAETPGCVSVAAPASGRRRSLEEIAVVSRLFDAIQRGATSEAHLRDSGLTSVVTPEPTPDRRREIG